MQVFGALVLLIVMYFVIPIAICVATLVALGGAENFLPAGMRERAAARSRASSPEQH
jgi:hypothetical protein